MEGGLPRNPWQAACQVSRRSYAARAFGGCLWILRFLEMHPLRVFVTGLPSAAAVFGRINDALGGLS
jgi:hypothetical protein